MNEGVFSFHVDLWCGGWEQWQNPLWNFSYLPATIFYLALPLKADMEWSEMGGVIPLSALEEAGAVTVHQVEYQIYRVVCRETP